MVKDHSDSERGNQLPPHGLLFPILVDSAVIISVSGQDGRVVDGTVIISVSGQDDSLVDGTVIISVNGQDGSLVGSSLVR